MTAGTVRLRTLLAACLAGGAGSGAIDAEHAATLADSATDHLALAALAGRHLVTPAVAEAVAATPGLAADLPDDFAAYLALVLRANRRRNRALRRELGQVARQLNACGITPVLLKGAVRLVDGLYPHAGWRFLRDLDLLVPAERTADACAALEQVGYQPRSPRRTLPNGHRHLPGLVRAGGAAPVELHLAPLALGSPLCDAAGVTARARPTTVDGACLGVPHPADQLVLLVEHDRTDEELRQAGRFLLRSALEFSAAGPRPSSGRPGGSSAVRRCRSRTGAPGPCLPNCSGFPGDHPNVGRRAGRRDYQHARRDGAGPGRRARTSAAPLLVRERTTRRPRARSVPPQAAAAAPSDPGVLRPVPAPVARGLDRHMIAATLVVGTGFALGALRIDGPRCAPVQLDLG